MKFLRCKHTSPAVYDDADFFGYSMPSIKVPAIACKEEAKYIQVDQALPVCEKHADSFGTLAYPTEEDVARWGV